MSEGNWPLAVVLIHFSVSTLLSLPAAALKRDNRASQKQESRSFARNRNTKLGMTRVRQPSEAFN